jgi:hypothetical protein
MSRIFFFLILAFSFIVMHETRSQGCNDAGLCTFGEFGTMTSEQQQRFTTEVSYIFGLGEKQNLINTLQLDQRFSILDNKGQVFLRLPFTYVYGRLGQTTGLGDVTAGLDLTLYQKDELKITAMAGGKIPPNKANISQDGRGLPMAYQTSLGTYDLILGANMYIQKWRIGAGYQKPFGENGNTFLHQNWEDNEDALEYWESNKLKRGDDVMLRVDRYFTVREKNSFFAGLLSVYRLQKDRIEKNGEEIALEESNGLTLNASLGYSIALQNNGSLRLLLAAPIITRKVRADGLTRTAVFSLTYLLGTGKKKMMVEIP